MVAELFKIDPAQVWQRNKRFVDEVAGKECVSPLDEAIAGMILRRSEFVEHILADHLEDEPERSDVPAVKALHHRFSLENIAVKAHEIITDPSYARRVAIHLCHQYSGAKLAEIGSYFGLSDSGVSKASSRLRTELQTHLELRHAVNKILFDLGRGNVQL